MINQDFLTLFTRVQARLKFQFGEATYNSWLKNIEPEDLSAGQVTLLVPSRFVREWIMSHYLDAILHHIQKEDPSIHSVDLRIQSGTSSAAATLGVTDDHEKALIETHVRVSPQRENLSSPLDARYTFDSFVTGPTNALAHAAARNLAENGTLAAGNNPLFLCGGVGLGKTHLMHAIAQHIGTHQPERQVCYMSAEKFMYQFIRALRNQDIDSFKDYFRHIDVLLIDDIQFICGKEGTQREFFHTFNALMDANRHLVISGDRSPCDLEGLDERIRSRLGWGLVADIGCSTFELRLSILQQKTQQLGVDVPRSVMEFLAHKITSNIRELEGALNKVVAHAQLIGLQITLDNTQDILRDLLRANTRSINIDDIQKAVANHCRIRLTDMQSARRARQIARPRQMAMYLSKKLTPCSLPEIGRRFGGKDHTTVMHAVKRIEELYHSDKELRNDIDLLTRMLQS